MLAKEVFDFGLRLKKMRRAAKYTQKEVAERLEVSRNVIGRYENNILQPPVDSLEIMAVMYNTTLDYLRNFDKGSFIYIGDLPDTHQRLLKDMIVTYKKSFNTQNTLRAND